MSQETKSASNAGIEAYEAPEVIDEGALADLTGVVCSTTAKDATGI